LGAITAIADAMLDPSREVVQKSSKSANVRCTAISRVSTASRPAALHNLPHGLDPTRFNARLIARRQPDRPHLDPDRLQGKTTAGNIPSISRDHPARAHNPHHLSDALGRMGHEETQCHGGCVVRVIRDGERHRIAMAEFGQARRRPRARKSNLGLGWINATDLGCGAPLDEMFSEGAVAAADIDPLQARGRGQSIDECRTGKPAPRSHHPFVGGAVIEANLIVRHEFFRLYPKRRTIVADGGRFATSSIWRILLIAWAERASHNPSLTFRRA
jgi:hypothetical protein